MKFRARRTSPAELAFLEEETEKKGYNQWIVLLLAFHFQVEVLCEDFSLLKSHALDVFSPCKLLFWDGQLGSLLFSETSGGSLDNPCSVAAVPHTAAMAKAIKKGVKMCSVWVWVNFFHVIFSKVQSIYCMVLDISQTR